MGDMIDWNRLADLRAEVGEDGFIEVVELFLEETDEVIARLEAGRQARLADDLHFLMGGALNLGLRRFARCCQAAERLCAKTREIDIGALVALYRESCAALRQGMTRPDAA